MQPKEILSQFKESGYVFHGSPEKNIEILEPRQAHHIHDTTKPEEKLPDGIPSISATPHPEIATFRALINSKNIPFDHTSGFGITSGKIEFEVSSKDVLDATRDKKGYVYVFDKKDFAPYDRNGNPRPESMEWRSSVPVRPVDIIEVTADDLPNEDQIEIINS